MIRPITCVTLLMAGSSGLYLYQAKHRAHVLDTQIEQIAHQTESVREQTRILHAEWTLLDQPDRLQRLATSLLNLQPTKPAQFVPLADLDSRLPPVPPPPEATTEPPAAASLDQAPLATSEPDAGRPVSSVPSAPVAKAAPARQPAPAVAAAPHPSEHPPVRVAERPRPVERPAIRAVAQRPPEPLPDAGLEPARPAGPYVPAALPRPLPVLRPYPQPPLRSPAYVQSVPTPGPGAGSMLGMAHAAPPPPAPMPLAPWTH